MWQAYVLLLKQINITTTVQSTEYSCAHFIDREPEVKNI